MVAGKNGAVRAHVIVPKTLMDAVDQVVGKRQRRAFVAEALEEKLARRVQADALRSTAGALDPKDYPEWSTPEGVSAWVRAGRAADDRRAPTARQGDEP